MRRGLTAWGGLFATACSVAFLGAVPAHAGVIEIGDDGVVRQRSDTATVQWVERDGGARKHAGTAVSGLAEASAGGLPLAALSPLAAASVPEAWRAPLENAAARHGVSPHLLAALVWQESRWHPQAISPKGAVGLGQLMPATARQLAVDPRDPQANLDGAARYLRQMLDTFGGDIDRALAAYNAGAARVIRAGGVPPIAETRLYVASILNRMALTTDTGLAR